MRHLLVVSVGLVAVSTLQANPITNGNIILEVKNTNGAIKSVIFGGAEFYDLGFPVSDYGFQLVGDTSSFVSLDASGSIPFGVTITSVTSASNVITVTGKYGNDISFTRTYSFVSGLDVIRTTTTLTNNGSSSINLYYFDTFDPDQGVNLGLGYSTKNDVSAINGITTAEATANGGTGLTVIIGGPEGTTGFMPGGLLFSLGILSSPQLLAFLGGPFDPNGALNNRGNAIVFTLNLVPGIPTTVRFDQAFGLTLEAARNQFANANPPPGNGNGGGEPIPEPATLLTLGLLGLAGLAAYRRRH